MGRWLAALAMVAVACGSSPTDPPTLPTDGDGGYPDAEPQRPDVREGADTMAPVPTFWRQVVPVLEKRCWTCHGDGARPAGAPRIMSYEETQADSALPGQSIAERMGKRVLEADGTPGDMPQRGSTEGARMTLTERHVITDWANGGAPEGPRPDAGMPPAEDGGEVGD